MLDNPANNISTTSIDLLNTMKASLELDTDKELNRTSTFKAEGFVIGNLWGGGQGTYEARKYTANTREELVQKCTEALDSGSMDNGMGFESLVSAMIDITKITTIVIDGVSYENEDSEIEMTYIGNMTAQQKSYLLDALCDAQ